MLIIIKIVNTFLANSSGEDHLKITTGVSIYSIYLVVENRWVTEATEVARIGTGEVMLKFLFSGRECLSWHSYDQNK